MNKVYIMMYLEDIVLEFLRKVVSLPWIWIPAYDYTADLIDIHEG